LQQQESLQLRANGDRVPQPVATREIPDGGVTPPRSRKSASRSIGSWVLLLLVRMYIVFLSPFLGGACKFYPSCSNYAREAIERHGARRGAVLALRRLLRCHPFTRGGIDFVPDELPDARRPALASARFVPSGQGKAR
jgi:putative membrane protein insertion efficiency factor